MNGRQKNRVSTLVVRLLYVIGFTLYLGVMAWLLSGCERRELYVYGDNFQSVELEVNWRKYADRDPDGMTVWFYPLGGDPLEKPYRTTTASVRKQSLYLPGGLYNGVVVDYSPEEYSRQRFVDMDELFSARVEATPATYQPDSMTVTGEGVPAGLSDEVNALLYGDGAWTVKHEGRTSGKGGSGYYMVSSQPEQMGLDTLSRVLVERSAYGDYVPLAEKDSYQSQINVMTLHAEPQTIVWHVRVRVFVSDGFNYLWQTPASITGLADGHYLAVDRNTDTPCMIGIDDWEAIRTGENSGYLQTTFTTFGLRPGSVKGGIKHKVSAGRRGSQTNVMGAATRAGETEPEGNSSGWYDYETDLCDSDELRLNLAFVLRDHSTVINYQFDVGEQVVCFEEQLVLRLDLTEEYFDPDNPDGGGPDVKSIVLPYVEAFSGTGFNANVSEWQEGGTADTTM